MGASVDGLKDVFRKVDYEKVGTLIKDSGLSPEARAVDHAIFKTARIVEDMGYGNITAPIHARVGGADAPNVKRARASADMKLCKPAQVLVEHVMEHVGLYDDAIPANPEPLPADLGDESGGTLDSWSELVNSDMPQAGVLSQPSLDERLCMEIEGEGSTGIYY